MIAISILGGIATVIKLCSFYQKKLLPFRVIILILDIGLK